MELHDTLRAVAASVRSRVEPPRWLHPAAGMDVYRRNRLASRIEVITDRYPIVALLLGPRNLRTLVARYDQAHPCGRGGLGEYGDALPTFVASDHALCGAFVGIDAFTWADFALRHPARPHRLELTLPRHTLVHYKELVRSRALADLPLGEPHRFVFERDDHDTRRQS